jgi:hypothetical protein
MAVRKATPANTSDTDGDYEMLQMSAGRLWTSTTVDAALPSGTNNIGDVDVLTVPADPFGANADAASATGSISAKLRFIASTGIPVTGTVTVGSHAVTNAGTFAVQDSEKIADNAGFTDGTTKVQPAGYIFDEAAGTALTENDAAAARIDSKRAQIGVIEDATTRGQRAAVDAGGALSVKEKKAATPSQSSVSVTSGSTSILASNANRLGATIYNEGSAICYMKLGSTASTTSYTLQIASGGYYEIPFGYTGAIDGITSSGTAQLRVTELT